MKNYHCGHCGSADISFWHEDALIAIKECWCNQCETIQPCVRNYNRKYKPKRVFISGLHGLKSEKKWDFEHNIAEGTHVQIHFCIYKDPQDTDKGWTTYDTIISNEELFRLLQDRCTKEVVPASS